MSDMPKAKRVLTQQQLENLKVAREKALERKKQMKDLTEKEKHIKKLEEEDRVKKINDKLAQLEKKPEPIKTKSKSKKENVKTIERSDEESDDEISDSSEEEYVAPKKSTRNSTSKRISVRPPKSNGELAVQVSKEELQERFRKQALAQAYNSLFGGLNHF